MVPLPSEEKLTLFRGMLASSGPLRLVRYDGRFYRVDEETKTVTFARVLYAGRAIDRFLN